MMWQDAKHKDAQGGYHFYEDFRNDAYSNLTFQKEPGDAGYLNNTHMSAKGRFHCFAFIWYKPINFISIFNNKQNENTKLKSMMLGGIYPEYHKSFQITVQLSARYSYSLWIKLYPRQL